MYIQQIRNATIKIKFAGTIFLIDPWFQDKGTGFSAKAIRQEMMNVKCPMNELPESAENTLKDVDYCLVSHLHFDHFSSDYLPKDVEIIAQNKKDASAIISMGFNNTKWFDAGSIVIGNVTIHKIKAIHGENTTIVQKMGEACGYVFEAPGEKTLYLAGDTVYCQNTKEAITQYQPDVIILNCCGATTPIGRLLMDLSDVEKVCNDAPNAIVIASHLDSVNHALITSDDVRKFKEVKHLSQLFVPNNGETIKL
ncbi:MBL fold metallo-hydrolase [Streptococcus jiangjianxini]|uniref:MBL fold metallo-hydrolase n=1 Tax=Streptococcus jiangjianxini TaxID=3161189 RepID=UPI0032EE33FC